MFRCIRRQANRLLQYLCENAVQPEIWGDVIADWLPVLEAEQNGGAAGAR